VNITGFLDLVRGVIRNPTADLTLTILLLAGLVLLLLALDIVVLLLISPRRKRIKKTVRRWVPDDAPDGVGEGHEAGSADEQGDESEDLSSSLEASGAAGSTREIVDGWEDAPSTIPDGEQDGPPSLSRTASIVRAIGALAAPLLLIASVTATYAVSGADFVCASACHAENPAVQALHENDHLHRASCVSCHERGTGTGVIGGTVFRAEMLLAWSGLADAPAERPVTSAACLRCHDVMDGPIVAGRANVVISHVEPVEAGMNCTDCHGAVGHLGEVARVPVSMDMCLGCHDGDTAFAECEGCHTTDIAMTGRDSVIGSTERVTGSGKYAYPPVTASDAGCEGCHEVETQCDPCHGLRLPHPDEFVEGYHAADAAFEKKDACLERCHTNYDCQQCHAPFSVGHAENWKIAHQASPWDSGCGCHGDGTNEDIPICVFCHENAPYDTVGERFR
jgi:hypothetical protein